MGKTCATTVGTSHLSLVVERVAFNHVVVGSIPTNGAVRFLINIFISGDNIAEEMNVLC